MVISCNNNDEDMIYERKLPQSESFGKNRVTMGEGPNVAHPALVVTSVCSCLEFTSLCSTPLKTLQEQGSNCWDFNHSKSVR